MQPIPEEIAVRLSAHDTVYQAGVCRVMKAKGHWIGDDFLDKAGDIYQQQPTALPRL